jgi:acyl carrier protein
MLEKIREIILRYADVESDQITEDARLAEDLGLDSFSLASIMGDAEQEFDIVIDETQLVDIYTVGDVLKFLETTQG